MPGSDVYFCVSIDVECDKGPRWLLRRPMSFRGVTEGVGQKLQPLFRRYGVRPTYLLSSEVIADGGAAAVFRSIAAECELGTHLHGELTEPGAHDTPKTAEFQRDYPPAVERAKLTTLTERFAATFEQAPVAFRAGRFGVGPASLGFLEELGYAVDSSVTPGIDWAASGAPGLSFVGAPTQPYHPDPREPARVGRSRLLEVPVTTRQARPTKIDWIDALVRPLMKPRWLRPTWGTAQALIALAQAEIAASRTRSATAPIVLNVMFHNVEVVPGTSPYASSQAEADALLGRLERLCAFAGEQGFTMAALSEIPRLCSWPRQAA